jgi:hypothetical protein
VRSLGVGHAAPPTPFGTMSMTDISSTRDPSERPLSLHFAYAMCAKA